MGNHHDDCRHCGRDQRSAFPCCETVRNEERAARELFRVKQARFAQLLDAFGIAHVSNCSTRFRDELEVVPRCDSLFAFLERLEKTK